MGESTRAITTSCCSKQIDVITLAFSGRIDNNRPREKDTKRGQRGERERERQRAKQQNKKNNAKLTTATPACLGATPVAQWGIVNFHTTTTDMDTDTDTLTATDTVTSTWLHCYTATDTCAHRYRYILHCNVPQITFKWLPLKSANK